MSDPKVGSLLSLLGQGLSIWRTFGSHSLLALTSIAETIEDSVYERGSLARSSSGLTFRLSNPPLRTGAFASLRLSVEGVSVPAERARIRVRVHGGPGVPWRSLKEISHENPLELRPGDRSELAVDGPLPALPRDVTIRLELQSTTIPPLVWFEFTDVLGPEASA